MEDFGFGTQIRKSPFFDATVKWGAKDFSVYNHMYIPRDFGNPEQNFWNLINDAILCDVAVERQVQVKGPDAGKFVQMMTPRDLSNMKVGQCKYVILVNQNGGVLNDPILLKVVKINIGFHLRIVTFFFGLKGWQLKLIMMLRYLSLMYLRFNFKVLNQGKS
jgi:aminomethyltransferase